jgi:hypothetical protein
MTGFPPVSGNTRFKRVGGQLGVLWGGKLSGPNAMHRMPCTDEGSERSAGTGHKGLKVLLAA